MTDRYNVSLFDDPQSQAIINARKFEVERGEDEYHWIKDYIVEGYLPGDWRDYQNVVVENYDPWTGKLVETALHKDTPINLAVYNALIVESYYPELYRYIRNSHPDPRLWNIEEGLQGDEVNLEKDWRFICLPEKDCTVETLFKVVETYSNRPSSNTKVVWRQKPNIYWNVENTKKFVEEFSKLNRLGKNSPFIYNYDSEEGIWKKDENDCGLNIKYTVFSEIWLETFSKGIPLPSEFGAFYLDFSPRISHVTNRVVCFDEVYELNREDGTLHHYPLNRDLGITQKLNYRPTPGEFPRFASFLNDVFGEEDEYSKEVIRCAFFKSIFGKGSHLQKGLMITGERQSGKGTLLEILREFVPKASLVNFSVAHIERRFEPYNWVGKSCLMDPDARKMNSNLVDLFLKLLSNDPLKTEIKGVNYAPTLEGGDKPFFIIATNNPKSLIKDREGAMSRRLITLKTRGEIDAEKVDIFLLEKLKVELPQILHWVLYRDGKLVNEREIDLFLSKSQSSSHQQQLKREELLERPESQCLLDYLEIEEGYQEELLRDSVWMFWESMKTNTKICEYNYLPTTRHLFNALNAICTELRVPKLKSVSKKVKGEDSKTTFWIMEKKTYEGWRGLAEG